MHGSLAYAQPPPNIFCCMVHADNEYTTTQLYLMDRILLHEDRAAFAKGWLYRWHA